MAKFNVKEIVDNLLRDRNLLENRSRFVDALQVSPAVSFALNQKLNKETIDIRQYFKLVIDDWISRNGAKGDIKTFSDLLELESFLKLSGKSFQMIHQTKFLFTFAEQIRDIQNSKCDQIARMSENDSLTGQLQNLSFRNIPPFPGFVGRAKELKQLHSFLLNESEAVLVVYGMGGFGKSQLCRKFVQGIGKSCGFATTWLLGDSFESVKRSLVELSKKLGLSVFHDATTSHVLETQVTEISKRFEKDGLRWLVVLDNVYENYEDLGRFASNIITCNSKLILTTRRVDVLSQAKEKIVLQPLLETDAIILLQTGLSFEISEKEARQLCAELGNHPLGLRQAVAYINAERCQGDSNYSVAQFLSQLKASNTSACEAFQFKDQLSGYEWTVFSIVEHVMDCFKRRHGKEGASAILLFQILSRIDPEGIDLHFLDMLFNCSKTEEVEPVPISTAVRLIKMYSLIEHRAGSVYIHRLIQLVGRTVKVDSQVIDLLLKNIARELEDLSPTQLVHVFSFWRHVLKDNEEVIKKHYQIPRKLFSAMNNLSLFKQLITFAEENHRVCVKAFGPHSSETLEMEHNIAVGLYEEGQWEKALSAFLNLYEKSRVYLGENHIQTLSTGHLVGFVLYNLGRFEDSLKWLEDIYSRRKEKLSERHINTLNTANLMALALKGLGKLKEAKTLLGQNMSKLRTNFGEDHEEILACRQYYARCLYEEKSFSVAKTEFLEIVKIRTKKFGEKHNDTLCSLYDLALTEWELGERADGIHTMQRILTGLRDVLGKNHPHMLTAEKMLSKWTA